MSRMKEIFNRKQSIFIRKVKTKNHMMLTDKLNFSFNFDAGMKGWELESLAPDQLLEIEKINQQITELY